MSNRWAAFEGMRAWRERAFVVLAVATVASATAPAAAQPGQPPQDATVKEVARQRYAAGVKAFDAGQFEDARVAFLEAYKLTQAPGILLNLGISELRTNRVAEGGNHLLRFLRDYADATPEERASAQASLEECKRKASLIEVHVDAPGAEVTLDGALVGKAPLADPVFVEPGPHELAASDGSNNATARVDAKRGQSVKASLRLRTTVGGVGESCRARSDCEGGLKCLGNVCRDELWGSTCRESGDCGPRLACIDQVCGVPGEARDRRGEQPVAAPDEPDAPPRGFDGARPHIGVMLGGGPTHTDNTNLGTEGSLLFSIKGGVLLDRAELGLEFSPASFVLAFGPDLPMVQLNAYVGYHAELAGPVSWPLRFGVGFSHFAPAGGQTDDITLEGRADLVGVSILVDPILLDFFVPSFRVNSNLDRAHFFTYVFGVGASWLPI